MEIHVLSFAQLSTQQLYEVLQLRSAVFVVEQDCVYQDIDGKDQVAIHVLGYEKGVLAAYTRIFKAGNYLPKAAIGRVLVHNKYRKLSFGQAIMKASMEAVSLHYKTKEIEISAQTYLLDFYQNLGFKSFGNHYLEDGIPHIKMQTTA
jgi:ElaA protein